jgi:hypothetical protein
LDVGIKSAQDFDFAVDQLLMQNPAFNDVLSARVSELRDRLLKALAPFFVSEPSQKNPLDYVSTEAAEIKDFVHRALKLKLDLLSSPYLYSFITFRSGDTFDPNTMRIETENGSSVSEPGKYPATVELCVSPALLQSLDRRDASGKGKPQSIEFGEASFRHNNFMENKSGCGEPVMKAVVLLQK